MRIIGTLLAAGCLAFAPAAGASIVPQKSIAGVRIGMTQKKVKDVLGTPLKRRRQGEFTFWTFAHRVEVAFRGGTTVTSVTVTGRFHRTASGVGVGSTRKEVRAGLAGESCNGADCFVGDLRPGTVYTDFSFGTNGGRTVRSVSLVLQRP